MQLALSAVKITVNASVLRLSICIRSALTNLLGDGKCRVTIKRHQYIPQNAAAFGVMRIRSFHSAALPALRLDSLEPVVVYSSLRMAASRQALPDGHCPEVADCRPMIEYRWRTGAPGRTRTLHVRSSLS